MEGEEDFNIQEVNEKNSWLDSIKQYLPLDTVLRYINYWMAGNQRIGYFFWIMAISTAVLFLPLQNSFLEIKQLPYVQSFEHE